MIVTNLENIENKRNREGKRKRRIERRKDKGYRVINRKSKKKMMSSLNQ